MSIEEIIERLEFAARYIDGKAGKTFLLGDFDVKALCSAIEKLRTHPDAQPNEPLTLEELQGMIGEPVWVESPGFSREISGRWTIVEAVSVEESTLYTRRDYTCRSYGVVWVAYRRPPKEEQR